MCMCVLSCSVVSDSATPWTIAHHAPVSMEFSRQKYWSGLPFASPEDHADPGIQPVSLASPASAGGFFTTAPPEKLCSYFHCPLNWMPILILSKSE